MENKRTLLHPFEKQKMLTGSQGRAIFYRHYQGEKNRPSLLVVHGFGEHGGRYGEVVNRLRKEGFSIFVPDLRGHGLSSGQRGHVQHFCHYLEDLQLLMAKESLYRPLVLGHSMGGLISIRLVQNHPHHFGGLILSCPFLRLKLEVPPFKLALGRFASRLLPRLSLPSEVESHQISRAPQVVKDYERDPLIHYRASARWFTEILKAQDQAGREVAKLKLPLLMQIGTGDLICDHRAMEDFFQALPPGQKTLQTYEGYYHEIYHDLERERCLEDLEKWLKRNFPSPSYRSK